MKSIMRTIMACCCLLLLIGCHKEQSNPTGIAWTEYVHSWDTYHNSRIIAHDGIGVWDFDIVIDSVDRHELFCNGYFYDTDCWDCILGLLQIPGTIIANVRDVENGYRTVTFTVTGISNGAFENFSDLTSVTLPNSIREIGYRAFEGCSSLATCTCYALDPPEVYWDLFEGSPLQAIYVPRESVEAYKTADGWEHYADIIFPIE